jgi:hypothetical protein
MTTRITDETTGGPLGLPPMPIAVPDDVLRTAERLGVDEHLSQVIELSQELFANTTALGVIEDPELADWTHIGVYVRLSATVEEAVAKHEAWYDSLRDLIGDTASSFVLLADVE